MVTDRKVNQKYKSTAKSNKRSKGKSELQISCINQIKDQKVKSEVQVRSNSGTLTRKEISCEDHQKDQK